MTLVVEAVVALLILFGAAFALLGSIALTRFPDLLTRLHGPSKATTLGIGSVLVASIVYFSMRGSFSAHELLITIFLMITTPVSAQFIAKAHFASMARRQRDGADGAPKGTSAPR
ncbi:MAG: Na+/H+ antiporter subunit G [Burkholderiales bacterium]|nr:Na+/H+ antiporter subunit G [Burkholderiales bacterium]